MSNIKMIVHDAMSGAPMVFHLTDEEEYHLAEKFLMDIGASRDEQSNDISKPEFHLKNQQQRDAFLAFRRLLGKRRSPSSDPPSLEMDVYIQTNGVQMTIAWTNEEEYQIGRNFLMNLGASCGQSSERRHDKPAFFYLENENQLEALFEFRQSLREKGK